MSDHTPDPHGGLSRRALLGSSAAALAATAGCSTPSPASPPRPSASDDGEDRLVLLGTGGGPPPERDRNGISTALVVDGRTYLLDCGRGSVNQYQQAGLRFETLAGIFLSHLHADHVCDYYSYFLLAGFGNNDSGDGILHPVDVHGPGPAGALPKPFGPPRDIPVVAPGNPAPGLAELTELQIRAFAYSTNVFLRDSGINDVRDLIRVHEVELPDVGAAPLGPTAPPTDPFVVTDTAGLRVTATLVPHGPVFPALAFRFDTPTASVVYSGDTAPSDNLVRLARGADILLHEVIDTEFYAHAGLSPALLDHLEKSHTDVTDVGPLAQRAGVETLVLTHLVPADVDHVSADSWRRRAQRGFDGTVVVGEDLLTLPLPHR